jgi:SAM-dependent methyltransferase
VSADEVFANDTFASLYDYFNPWTPSDQFYLELARQTGQRVLDLGCGTGMLACRIAAEGHEVTGVDSAKGMLNIARSRPGAERVSWIEADGRTLQLGQHFDLIYMTGHAFQALLTDADAVALLRSAAKHLAPDGCVALESRNPACKAWLSWTRDNGRVVATEQHGRIEESYDTDAEPASGIVRLTHYYRFLDQGTTRTGYSRLRFIEQPHLARLLVDARLVPIIWHGDWDRTPLRPDSREMIVMARAQPDGGITARRGIQTNVAVDRR